MKIVIVLDTHRIYVFQNEKLIGFNTISSGKKGKETPTGIFNILQKNVDHKSNLYSNAPMPFMQRLTWDGIAIHGGDLLGYLASHGCIRLPHPFSKALFGVIHTDRAGGCCPSRLVNAGQAARAACGCDLGPCTTPSGCGSKAIRIFSARAIGLSGDISYSSRHFPD